MRDALGRVRSVLVLGGTSEIGMATARALVGRGARHVTLAVRDPLGAGPLVDELLRLGAEEVTAVAFDARDTGAHERVIGDVFAGGDVDLVLMAFGVLGDQATFDADPAAAVDAVTVNYLGAVSAGLAVARHFRRQGHGTLVVLSSVAAERARRSNFVYGSSKAGLDAFAQGLGDALVGSGARVLVVRPGFVHSRMTEGLAPQPFATTPEVVAEAVVRGLERDAELIWVPPVLRIVFAVLRHLPRPLWRIVSARG